MDIQFFIRVGTDEKIGLVGITAEFAIHPGRLLDKITECAAPHRVWTPSEEHLRNCGRFASSMKDAAVFSDPELFRAALTGQWSRMGGKDELHVRHFHSGGLGGFVVAEKDNVLTTPMFLRQMDDCIRGVGEWLGIVANAKYTSAFQPIRDYIIQDDNVLFSVPNFQLLDMVNAWFANVFTTLRMEDRLPPLAPLCGEVAVQAFIKERVEVLMATFGKLTSQAGPQMTAHFVANDLPRMRESGVLGFLGAAAKDGREAAKTKALPNSVDPRPPLNLCAAHLRARLSEKSAQPAPGCTRVGCSFLHYATRFAKVKIEAMKKIIQDSSLPVTSKFELEKRVDKAAALFKK
jgi:hypothetical protein